MRFAACFPACIFLLISSISAQHRVDLRNTYERVLCVVPMVGAGTPEDPRRPMFAPVPGKADPGEGIIAFSFQASEDGQRALVEFVARDRAAFAGILKTNRDDVKVFERGRSKREDIEKEFRKHKKDFNFERWGVMVP